MARTRSRRRPSALAGAVLVVALAGQVPAAAHISGNAAHNWGSHYRPLADKRYYTKQQADGRYARTGHHHDARYWRLIGNAGAGADSFLGTTDNQALRFRVNNQPALRLEPRAGGVPAVVGGWSGNIVGPDPGDAAGATIGGGGCAACGSGGVSGPNLVQNAYGVVAGGAGNRSLVPYDTVGGGYFNTAGGHSSTIGGGRDNTVQGLGATIGGGLANTASGSHATIGGGQDNLALGKWAAVGGGDGNEAADDWATVGGGASNTAGTMGTVGGGALNEASGVQSTVGGGRANKAGGLRSTVGGGESNVSTGQHATVPGGGSNAAEGGFSFAAGRNAQAGHEGSFVWADATGDDQHSSADHQFTVRASGGVRMFTNDESSTGVTLAAGGGSWSSLSDRAVKAELRAVSPGAILAGVSQLPISTWSYTSQDPSIRHIGPTAQDFHAAFGVGESDRHITTLDADGVALAAIQGLNEKVTSLEARLAASGGAGAGGSLPLAEILQAMGLLLVALALAVVGRRGLSASSVG